MKKTKPSSAKAVDNQLVKAAAKGDLKLVRERIAAGADVNASPKDDAPPLFGAVASGKAEVVRELISAGAKIDCIARRRYASLKTTPLCQAIEQGNWEICQELLKAGANIAINPWGETNAASEAAQQAIKAFQEVNDDGEDWLGKRRTNSSRDKAKRRCELWTQFVREAIATKIPVRDYWLWAAAGAGYEEMVRLLIAAGTNVNAAPHSSTALNKAISRGHESIARALIEAGADLKALNNYEPAPLLLAAAKNQSGVVSALLDAGADINVAGRMVVGEFGDAKVEEEVDAKGKVIGRTTHIPNPPVADASSALVVAVRLGNRALVRLLIDRGANLNLGDRQGVTPLAWATRLNHHDLVEMLQQAGAVEPEFLEGSVSSALMAAARTGDTPKITELLSRGVNPNEPVKDDKGTHLALVEAARGGNLAAVQTLLKAGADVQLTAVEEFVVGVTPLMVSAKNGHVEAMQALLAAGAQVEAKDKAFEGGGETALHYAARGGSASAIEALIEAGAKLNAKAAGGRTPLLVAVTEGKQSAVKALLRAGADANASPRDGSGSLWHAADALDLKLVRLLLEHGASPSPQGKGAVFTPLAAAAAKGSLEIVNVLLEAGAPVNALDHFGPALSSAALYGHEDVIEVLLAAGADPSLADREGFTSLMAAVRAGKASCVQRLLRAGAEPNAAKESGETAMDMAKQDRTREIVAILEAAGAKSGKQLKPKTSTARPSGHSAEKSSEAEEADFSEAAKSSTYQAVVTEVGKLCGTSAKALLDIAGGYSFAVARAQLEKLIKERQQEFLARGAHLFRHERDLAGDRDKLGLLPTQDWADVIRAFHTNGANYDLMPADIIQWLKVLSADHPFTLTGAGGDWLEGHFVQPVKDYRKLAQKMYKFCPDIVDQGVGSVKALAEELEKKGDFFFWWD